MKSVHRPTKQHSRKHRESIHDKRQFERRTTVYGRADLTSFNRSLPGWYSPVLLKYRRMILSKQAMQAYYKACEIVGHYIGGAGWRSYAVQTTMTSSLAAPPGYSYHQAGMAFDVFGLSEEELRALLAVGFNPLPGDPGHYTYQMYG